jgi:hypothetical protein
MTKTQAGPRVQLPEPIANYLSADGGDNAAYSRCFAEDAVVRDEGHIYRGLAAITQWKADSKKKYQYTIEPLACARKGDKTIVTNRLTGNFPGSPVELQFVFQLDGNKVKSLEILP